MTISAAALSPGWAMATLPELIGPDGIFSDGDWVESKDQDPQGDVRLIQLADVGDGVFRDRSSRFLTSFKAAELNCTFLRPGDVLVARMPDPLGRACIFPGTSAKSVTAVDICIVRPGSGSVEPRWLMWTINAPQLRQEIAELQSGTTRGRISRRNLGSIPLPVPPFSEQRRIVAAIEEQFSRIDAGVEALQRVRRNLHRMRAAILHAAVTGELVPPDPEDEPAEVLLKHILDERRDRWNAERRGTIYREPPPVEPDGLPRPEHWAVASLEQLTDPVRVICYGILMPKENVLDGVLYVRVKDIRNGRIDPGGLRRTTPEIAAKYDRASLQPGDVLLAIRGTYGRVAIVPRELDGGNITQDTARIALHSDINRQFVYYYLSSPVAIAYFNRVARGVAVKGVNIGDLRVMPVPVPPLREQQRIVEMVQRTISLLDDLELEAERGIRRSGTLRRAVLACAFEGRLVPQDPSDEPAVALLERIATAPNPARAVGARQTRRLPR